jgi:SOS-response transcriptional repressor LexA
MKFVSHSHETSDNTSFFPMKLTEKQALSLGRTADDTALVKPVDEKHFNNGVLCLFSQDSPEDHNEQSFGYLYLQADGVFVKPANPTIAEYKLTGEIQIYGSVVMIIGKME